MPLIKSGGLRDSLPAGQITYREVLRAYIARHSPLKAGDYAPGDASLRQ